MSANAAETDVLVIGASDPFVKGADGEYVDPIWRALAETLQLGAPTPHLEGATEYLAELRAHAMYLESRDRFWRLHPSLRQRNGAPVIGTSHRQTVGGKPVLAYCSDLRLNTDGPTTPVMRAVATLVQQTRPRLVIFVGLGGGVTEGHRAGDVAVTASARLALRGELEGVSENGQTFGGLWSPTPEHFKNLEFDKLREPALVAPSPHYAPSTAPEPPEYRPRVRLESLPVLTRPMITETTFDIPSPDSKDRSYWGDEACAIDMDAAPVVRACGTKVPCAVVIGLATPAIVRFKFDYESSLRRAWMEHFIATFAPAAARNAAETVRRIIEVA